MNIYLKISDICKKNNMTIKDLEKCLNLSNGIIGKWKNSSPNIKYLMLICNYFNIDINELCYDIDKNDDQKLLSYFHRSDDRGKKNIISIAEIEAKRSQQETNYDEVLKPFA